MRVLIAAGGSGGHIFPAVALRRALAARGDCGVKFVASDKAIDRRILEREGVDFSVLSANNLPYRISVSSIVFFVRLLADLIRALWIVASYRPERCVGFGGYVSFPVVLWAKLFFIRTIVHEQNVVPGRANKILFAFSDGIAVSFEDTLERLSPAERRRAVVTGNPIRTEDFVNDRSTAAKSFGLDPSIFTVLVIGGSQGAHAINENFALSLSDMDAPLRSGIQVIHLTGVKDYEWAVKEYSAIKGLRACVFSFIDRIEDAYSASDLVITRAGASALFESAYFGKAMIVVPYPYALSHQDENANAFSRNGAAVKIAEKDLSRSLFRDTIESLFKDRAKMSRLGDAAKKLSLPDASAKLADMVIGKIR
jgi:UDP-N-acetylglucosamine--N-acetylmuramyl-(pentapeptide) pyrophosphoryl-undecaprenol N-acetylglucosamine transferase